MDIQSHHMNYISELVEKVAPIISDVDKFYDYIMCKVIETNHPYYLPKSRGWFFIAQNDKLVRLALRL